MSENPTPEAVAENELGGLMEAIRDNAGMAIVIGVIMLIAGIAALAAPAVAALIRCDGAKAGCRQRGQLVAPGEREFRESVQQDDRRAVALLIDGHANAVGLDKRRRREFGGAAVRHSTLLAQSIQSRAVGSASRRRGLIGRSHRSQSP